jgi:protocatechuate 3,4-dioxygenase beta subunit
MLQPTPACDDAAPTLAQTAGPFYTPNTPERTSLLEPGISGTRLVLSGRVWSTECQPLAGALLDFWQANDDGVYDNDGYRLRGHQFTDANGHYRLETIIPGGYPGRTRHIHVRVRGRHTRLLTTQLYFPGDRLNQRDGIFHPKLVVAMQEVSDGSKMAAFDFVLIS